MPQVKSQRLNLQLVNDSSIKRRHQYLHPILASITQGIPKIPIYNVIVSIIRD